MSSSHAHAVRAGLLALTFAVAAAALTVPALADHVAPLDECVGVDHPPFDRAYQGDGLSYLLFGATTPLDAYPPGSTLHGVLDGNGRSVEASDVVDDTGRGLLSFPLTSYGNYQLAVDVDGHPLGVRTVSVGPAESPCDREQLDPAPPPAATATETASPAQAPTQAPTTAAATPGPTVSAEPEELASSGGGFPWGVLIGGGLALGLAGLLVARGGGGPCEEERRAWEQARDAAERARHEAERARAEAGEATAERERLDAELAEIRKLFPDAGRPGGDDSWAESEGRRVTGRDVRMRGDAGRAAWERYRANPSPETAQEAMDAWNDADTPEAASARREVDARARELQGRRDDAAEAERRAEETARRAERSARDAADAEDRARAAYDECLGRARAPQGPGTAGGDEGGGGGGVATGPGATDSAQGGCTEGDEKEENVVTLGTIRMPVDLKVEITGGDAHESANAGRDIAGGLRDVSERLGWISLAMDLKGIGSKLVLDRDGWKALGESGAPLAGAATGTPVPTSPAQAVVDYLRTVAGIAATLIESVPEWQERRLPDCDLRATTRYRWLRVTCADLLRCDNGRWVPAGKRFTVTVEREGPGGTFKRDALTWAQVQAELAGVDDRFTAELVRAIEQLEELQRRCGAAS